MVSNYNILDTYLNKSNLTYDEFSQKLGLNLTTLYRAVTGRGNPSKKTRRKLDKFIRDNREEIESITGAESIAV